MGDIDVFGQRAMPQEEKVESEGRVRRRAVFPRSDEELMKESEGDGSDDDEEEDMRARARVRMPEALQISLLVSLLVYWSKQAKFIQNAGYSLCEKSILTHLTSSTSHFLSLAYMTVYPSHNKTLRNDSRLSKDF